MKKSIMINYFGGSRSDAMTGTGNFIETEWFRQIKSNSDESDIHIMFASARASFEIRLKG